MIQAPLPNGLRYELRLVPGAARGQRVAHALQSAEAADLLAALRQRAGVAEGPSSKSHSRDLVAVALAEAGRVGVDVEFRAPDRAIEKIAAHLGAPVADAARGYRVFTFWEAYFKAFGDWPEKGLLRAVAGSSEPLQQAGGMAMLHQVVEHDFAFTLVWGQR
jgi:hypothetical protein